ncbi:hypothetical protein EVAR_93502_1 [Eumeta japonica]|uniref:Uncharacterized protein n=1 Tax=Eumeta variegata TaxID=151549 RepID=A0A4C1TJE2_EUMVA|nr:hypothetical protein EVAR_93502_1 [Eumeta japonica]
MKVQCKRNSCRKHLGIPETIVNDSLSSTIVNSYLVNDNRLIPDRKYGIRFGSKRIVTSIGIVSSSRVDYTASPPTGDSIGRGVDNGRAELGRQIISTRLNACRLPLAEAYLVFKRVRIELDFLELCVCATQQRYVASQLSRRLLDTPDEIFFQFLIIRQCPQTGYPVDDQGVKAAYSLEMTRVPPRSSPAVQQFESYESTFSKLGLYTDGLLFAWLTEGAGRRKYASLHTDYLRIDSTYDNLERRVHFHWHLPRRIRSDGAGAWETDHNTPSVEQRSRGIWINM